MLPMLRKHTMITAALMATLTLSACGKKKDVLAAPPQQPTTTTTPAPVNEETGDTNGKIGGGLPGGDNSAGGDTNYNPPPPSSDDNEPTPLPGNDDSQSGNGNGGGNSNNNGNGNNGNGGGVSNRPSQRPVTPPVVDNKPAPNPGSNQIPSDYTPNDSANVTRDGLSKRFTGAVTPDGLLYTSSSTDELLDFLRARNERVSHESRRLNEQAAASVVFAKMNVDSLNGDVTVTLKVQEAGDIKVYNVVGSSEAGQANPLKLVRAGNGERTTGSRALEGTFKCIDFDGGCENILVRLKIGTSPSSAIINVVFRNSKADLWFSLPGQRSESPEYATLRAFMINSIQGKKSENKVKTSTIKSWEVVNGRSGMTVTLRGYNNELLGFAGPLLAPEAGTGVNIKLSRLAKDKEDSLDLINTNSTKLNYANWIAEARLIANNGLGQVRVSLKMRKVGAYGQDQFAVTFMRRIKPIVELDENIVR